MWGENERVFSPDESSVFSLILHRYPADIFTMEFSQPPSYEKKVKTIRSAEPLRRESSTLGHLETGWIPHNRSHLAKIIENLEHGEFEPSREALVTELVKDPALVFHTAAAFTVQSDENSTCLNPLWHIKTKPTHEILAVLSSVSPKRSRHRDTATSRQQALRLQFALLSTTLASEAAPQLGYDRDTAQYAACLRQLSYLLIAWNYPHFYLRAMHRQRRTEIPADVSLTDLLMISPPQISEHFARQWSCGPAIIEAVRHSQLSVSEDATQSAQAPSSPLSLSELCNLTELFAASCDKEHYPEQHQRWEEEKERVSALIGSEALRSSTEIVASVLHETYGDLEGVQKLPLVAEKTAAKRHTNRGIRLFHANRALQRCSVEVSTAFEPVYEAIGEDKVAVHALGILAADVYRRCGFLGGCLALFSRTRDALLPTLRIGPQQLSHYQTLFEINVDDFEQALLSPIPVCTTASGVYGEYVGIVTCSLRNPAHPGILYLEYDEPDLPRENFDPLLHFQAFHCCVNHCIGLEP